ncbi:type II secretion system F family protein [Zhongshania aquimaris]|uniref:Type II secretion system F family protein n=1 Tax=Zhongshania aquimaris TaxID=2857107 RepID=A0ABS6VMZ6_9GAMM|nr:type II secretion system F family protein [Zhongshania aquimaris]MBW2939428.1 type II secretion system F family protein [Zhongshania aquimaris]
MMFPALVATLSFLALLAVIYSVGGSTRSAISQYDEQVKDVTTVSLHEIFIFIDDKTIKYISAAAFVIIALLVYIISSSVWTSIVLGLLVLLTPAKVVTILKNRRYKKFNRDLPDALMATAGMLKSGVNLSGALTIVVNENNGPLGQEFGLFLNELKLGVDFNSALDNMYRRVPISDLELVVAGMKISREVGGSLSEVLFRLSDTIRRRAEMEGKIKSLTAMGTLQGWVMTLLPIGVGFAIYLIEPETMAKLYTDWRGWIACFVIVVLEFLGYKTIKKIVNIDV